MCFKLDTIFQALKVVYIFIVIYLLALLLHSVLLLIANIVCNEIFSSTHCLPLSVGRSPVNRKAKRVIKNIFVLLQETVINIMTPLAINKSKPIV